MELGYGGRKVPVRQFVDTGMRNVPRLWRKQAPGKHIALHRI